MSKEGRFSTKNIRKMMQVLKSPGPSSTTPPKLEAEVQETLTGDDFILTRTARHGFPYQPTCMAVDPVQHLLAIGNRSGSIRIYGSPEVDCYIEHEASSPVVQLIFLVNEGALISVCTNDLIHLWNLRQRKPALIQSLKFNRERITYSHLPFQSKWLYVGTEKGNVHVVNVESFKLSGYIINWNKSMEVTSLVHPGPVVHLSDNPVDNSKILIGFEGGLVTLWDLKAAKAEHRYRHSQPLRSVSWHHEGKQFIAAHTDGTLAVWNIRNPAKPSEIRNPNKKVDEESGKAFPCTPITKVEWKSHNNGKETALVFAGGLPYENSRDSAKPGVTLQIGKPGTGAIVLEVAHKVVDFICLCDSPWDNDVREPHSVFILLEKDLLCVDLQTPGFPCYENPYSMDIHESTVTCVKYFSDIPADLIPALYSAGSALLQSRRTTFSKRKYPLTGGECGSGGNSYPELIITGHADGSLKFWDASSISLQVLYKLKTAKIFNKKIRSLDGEEEPFAIQHISMCLDSRTLCVVGAGGYALLHKFTKQQETTLESIATLDLSLSYMEVDEGEESPETDLPQPPPPTPSSGNTSSSIFSGGRTPATPTSSTSGSSASAGSSSRSGALTRTLPPLGGEWHCDAPNVALRSGPFKFTAGFLPDLCCQLLWTNGDAPPSITSLTLNASYGLLAFGTMAGLVIIDFLQKTTLLCMGTPDLYGSTDPYQRAPRSPKRGASRQNLGDIVEMAALERDATGRSPLIASAQGISSDQPNGVLVSPTSSGNSGLTSPQQRKGRLPPPLKRNTSQGGRRMLSKGSMTSLDPNGNGGAAAGAEGGAVGGDQGSFTPSRSSSLSSLDKDTREAVTSLAFYQSYLDKTELVTSPALWIGTSLGSVLVLTVNFPPAKENRLTQLSFVTATGCLIQMKGAVLNTILLNENGSLISPNFEFWKSSAATKEPRGQAVEKKLRGGRTSTSSISEIPDKQFLCVITEKQARVVALPSQSCCYRVQISEMSFVASANIINVNNSPCLAVYVASGRIMAFSVPSLRILMDKEHPLNNNFRNQHFICFASHGHALYMSTPSEIQRISIDRASSENLQEMLGELFVPMETPEPPSRGFFRELFGSPGPLDRDELFGEASGKASRSLAKVIPGPSTTVIEGLKAQSVGATSEIGRAKMAAIERGEKLGRLDDQTEELKDSSKQMSHNAHQLMQKYKDKKWYQF